MFPPVVIRRKKKNKPDERGSKTTAIIRTNSADSLNQPDPNLQLLINSMADNNSGGGFYQPGNRDTSNLDYILSPQMTKKLAQVGPMQQQQAPSHRSAAPPQLIRRYNSLADTDQQQGGFRFSVASSPSAGLQRNQYVHHQPMPPHFVQGYPSSQQQPQVQPYAHQHQNQTPVDHQRLQQLQCRHSQPAMDSMMTPGGSQQPTPYYYQQGAPAQYVGTYQNVAPMQQHQQINYLPSSYATQQTPFVYSHQISAAPNQQQRPLSTYINSPSHNFSYASAPASQMIDSFVPPIESLQQHQFHHGLIPPGSPRRFQISQHQQPGFDFALSNFHEQQPDYYSAQENMPGQHRSEYYTARLQPIMPPKMQPEPVPTHTMNLNNDKFLIQADETSLVASQTDPATSTSKSNKSNTNDATSSSRCDSTSDNYCQSLLTMESPRHGSTNRYHCGAKLELEHGRTPLFGLCPNWWGEMGKENATDEESRIKSADEPLNQKKNETSHMEPSTKLADTISSSPQMRRRENIRMDIPLASVKRDEPVIDKRKSGPHNAMAFTIDLSGAGGDQEATIKKRSSLCNPVSDESKAEAMWKQQSAERARLNFIRRSMRKSGTTPETPVLSVKPRPATHASAGGSGSQDQNADSKKFLIDKMLSDTTSATSNKKPSKLLEKKTAKVVESSRNSRNATANDNVSEAGTFVIERDRREEMEARQNIDQVFGITGRLETVSTAESSDDSCPDEALCMDAVIKPRSMIGRHDIKSAAPPPTSVGQSEKPVGAKSVASKSSPVTNPKKATVDAAMMKNVVVPRTSTNVGTKATMAPNRKSLGAPISTLAGLSAQPLRSRNPSPAARRSFGKSPGTTSTTATSFNREAAGRFSLRTFAPPQQHALSNLNRGATNSGAAPTPAKSAELNMWLRRKEYNPMKAAQQAKAHHLKGKQREEPAFLSNRSQSFHTGASGAMPKFTATLKKHQSIENNSEVSSGLGLLDRDEDFEAIEHFLAGGASNQSIRSPRLSLQEDDDDHSCREHVDDASMDNISKLTRALGNRAENLLSKLTLKPKPEPVNPTAKGASETSSQFDELIKRLELANQAFEVMDKFLKNQNESGQVEPCDPKLDDDVDQSQSTATNL